jgi:hypothetical protein
MSYNSMSYNDSRLTVEAGSARVDAEAVVVNSVVRGCGTVVWRRRCFVISSRSRGDKEWFTLGIEVLHSWRCTDEVCMRKL